MRSAATAARTPRSATDVVEEILGDLAPWLADEYTAVHGRKQARE
jgi:hypothetical protein